MEFAEEARGLAAKMHEKRVDNNEPLFKQEIRKTKGGSTGHLSFDKSVTEAFKLLEKNGYSLFINDKTPENEKLMNKFRAVIANVDGDPAKEAPALKDYDAKSLSQLFYMINKHAMRDDRSLVAVVKGPCLEGILNRAAELGPKPKF